MNVMTKRMITLAGLVACLALAAPTVKSQDKDACGNPMTPAKVAQSSKDYQDIQNVASAHEYYHNAWEHRAEMENAWSKRDDVTWKNNTDFYKGRKDLLRFYVTNAETLPKTGGLAYHMLTTPMIVVSGDGKTAKGIFMSFGNIAGAMKGKTMADWTEEKYGIDFIKEDGKWKIWHLRTYVEYYFALKGDFTNPDENEAAPESAKTKVGTSPAGGSQESNSGATIKEEPGSTFDLAKPTEKGNYYEGYYPGREMPFNPTIPKDYCHWDDSMAY
jgi:hypothetical protein